MKKNLRRMLALLVCVMMVFAFCACDTTGGGGKKDVIDAVEYGLDNTGKTDVTKLMMEMHKQGAKEGKTIYYPNGTYLFNGLTLDFTSGVEFESKDGVLIRNSVSETPIVNFDDNGNLIGLMHNHLEHKLSTLFTINGNLVSPPVSTANYETKVDFLPYWYNDFGLYHTYAGKGGSKVWYDWSWNHHSTGNIAGNVPYDPALHPLLGFYRGDDPVVLDWICYWFKEYGINQSIIYNNGAIDTATWEDQSSKAHWIYQLLNNAPNAKNLDFACYVWANSYKTNETEIRNAWWKTFDTFYFNEKYADMMYYFEKDGKKYPVLVLWDEQSIRHSMGGGNEKVIQLYKDAVQAFKDKGYEGICIMARTDCFSGDAGAAVRADLLANDILWFSCNYPKNSVPTKGSYKESIDSFVPSADPNRIYCVATGFDSHTPHPSEWNCPGTNPTDFARWIQKVVDEIEADDRRDPVMTCYNVSEWGEGGPGLVPTVKDRFGYLEAIRDTLVVK